MQFIYVDDFGRIFNEQLNPNKLKTIDFLIFFNNIEIKIDKIIFDHE